jgi:hypothetical protein
VLYDAGVCKIDCNHLKCGDIFKGMMVEETLSSANKPKVSEKCIIKYFVTGAFCYVLSEHVCTFQNKTARPRPVYLWTVVDVQKWLRRHCSDYYPLYWEKFQQVIHSI